MIVIEGKPTKCKRLRTPSNEQVYQMHYGSLRMQIILSLYHVEIYSTKLQWSMSPGNETDNPNA